METILLMRPVLRFKVTYTNPYTKPFTKRLKKGKRYSDKKWCVSMSKDQGTLYQKYLYHPKQYLNLVSFFFHLKSISNNLQVSLESLNHPFLSIPNQISNK